MRIFTNLVSILALISLFYCQSSAQDGKSETQKSESEEVRLEKESKYIAPIRYVIVYNQLSDPELSIRGRYIDLIIDNKQFNEANLIKVFELVKKRFPTPFNLRIEIHTNLATIETPEEREMASDNTGRLTDNLLLHKTATYDRFSTGREAFDYTTSLSPYKRKIVVIAGKSRIKP